MVAVVTNHKVQIAQSVEKNYGKKSIKTYATLKNFECFDILVECRIKTVLCKDKSRGTITRQLTIILIFFTLSMILFLINNL